MRIPIIDDTTGKGSRGKVPAEATEVEALVGTFDSERVASVIWSAQDFNDMAATHASTNGRLAPRKLSEEDLAGVRKLRVELVTRWRETAPGSALQLELRESARPPHK